MMSPSFTNTSAPDHAELLKKEALIGYGKKKFHSLLQSQEGAKPDLRLIYLYIKEEDSIVVFVEVKGAVVKEEDMSPLAQGSELWYNWNWIGKTYTPFKRR